MSFQVDTAYLGDPFLIGDVRVGGERHLLFATAHQVQILQEARRWYLDGTFRVAAAPFYQLWSIHAFLRP